MTTDPHIYKGEYCDLHIRPSDAPETVEVEVFSQKRKNGLWIEVPVAKVRSMLAASVLPGSYTRTDEKDWQAHAERAERALAEMTVHRDQCRDTAIKWQMEANRAVQPSALAPDAITDEMVERGAEKFRSLPTAMSAHARVRTILRAALTEPTRPEGAEEIEAYMRELVASHPEDHYGELADHLASRGVLPPLTDKTHPEEQP